MTRRVKVAAFGLALAASGCAAMVAGMYKATTEPGITTEKDEMTGISWVKPVLADRPGAGFYFYFAVDKTGAKQPMRAVFETWNESWVFAQMVLIKADDTLFELPIPGNEWKREVIPGGAYSPTFCAERADVPLGALNPKLVDAMCNASNLTVRFVGKDAQRTLDARTTVFTTVVKQVCEAYGPRPPAPAAAVPTAPVSL